MSLPNTAAVRENCVPVSCIPSPESPAKRMVTRSSSWTGTSWPFVMVTGPRALLPVMPAHPRDRRGAGRSGKVPYGGSSVRRRTGRARRAGEPSGRTGSARGPFEGFAPRFARLGRWDRRACWGLPWRPSPPAATGRVPSSRRASMGPASTGSPPLTAVPARRPARLGMALLVRRTVRLAGIAAARVPP